MYKQQYDLDKPVTIYNVEALNKLLELLDTPAENPAGSLKERYGLVEIADVRRLLTMSLTDPKNNPLPPVKKEDATHTACDVAKWLIECDDSANAYNGGGERYMALTKLQRLLYYSQGMFLARYNRPLFQDDICAWFYGPAVDAVQKRYERFRYYYIREKKNPEETYTKEERASLNDTFNAFGRFTGLWLSLMSRDDTPYRNTVQGEAIDLDMMRDYFIEVYLDKDGTPISDFEIDEEDDDDDNDGDTDDNKNCDSDKA